MNLIDRINITEKFGVLPEIQFTKSELGVAGLILQNCYKNEYSYLSGLMQVF